MLKSSSPFRQVAEKTSMIWTLVTWWFHCNVSVKVLCFLKLGENKAKFETNIYIYTYPDWRIECPLWPVRGLLFIGLLYLCTWHWRLFFLYGDAWDEIHNINNFLQDRMPVGPFQWRGHVLFKVGVPFEQWWKASHFFSWQEITLVSPLALGWRKGKDRKK